MNKPKKYCVEIKLRRYSTSENVEIYEFTMALFDNGELEEFLFFIRDFNTTLKESGMLVVGKNIQCLCTLVSGEVLHKIDSLSDDMGGEFF